MPCPAMIHSMIERRHHRQTRAPTASASARARRSVDVVPAKITSAPNARAPSILIFGRGRRHDDDRRRAELARGERHRLAVIAGRERDHPAPPLLVGQLRDHVVGAANLERAAGLQVLALQEQRPARLPRDVQQRCDARDARHPCRGGTDVVKVDDGMSFSRDQRANRFIPLRHGPWRARCTVSASTEEGIMALMRRRGNRRDYAIR